MNVLKILKLVGIFIMGFCTVICTSALAVIGYAELLWSKTSLNDRVEWAKRKGWDKDIDISRGFLRGAIMDARIKRAA